MIKLELSKYTLIIKLFLEGKGWDSQVFVKSGIGFNKQNHVRRRRRKLGYYKQGKKLHSRMPDSTQQTTEFVCGQFPDQLLGIVNFSFCKFLNVFHIPRIHNLSSSTTASS